MESERQYDGKRMQQILNCNINQIKETNVDPD